MSDVHTIDLLVIGSGAAGLSAALKAADLGARVAVLTAGAALAGSSPRAQGGVAAAIGADDAPALHAADTVSVGAGLNDAGAVAVLTREAGSSIRPLLDDGVGFEQDLGLEAGHTRRRIIHAGGGATGEVLWRSLFDRARTNRRITIFDHSPVWSIEKRDGHVLGARVKKQRFCARGTVVATGGYAALWGRSTNAAETRGTGLSLAWQAGASLADLEFVQFHPTALSVPGRPAFLLSEALRGEGARLIDDQGNEVVDPLLPRDVVARAIQRHHGQVFLSLQHLDSAWVHARFTRLAEVVQSFGLDLARDHLPVAPAAHYCMGGVRTDTWGRTDVPGLYAAGEVACTGVQGANRLASNSLLECLVFGARAAEAALTDSRDSIASWTTTPLSPRFQGTQRNVIAAIDPGVLGARLDTDLGVERHQTRLQRLVGELPPPEHAGSSDLLLASLITHAALMRTESRGAHFRSDFPSTDSAWRGRIHWRRGRPPAFEEVPA